VSLVTRVWFIITKETASKHGRRLRSSSEQTTGGGSPVWGVVPVIDSASPQEHVAFCEMLNRSSQLDRLLGTH